MLVLDTGVLTADDPRLPAGGQAAVCALTLAELEFGISAATVRGDAVAVRRRARRLSGVRAVFGEGLSFDNAASVAYGEITHAVLRAGCSPRRRQIDLLIAAAAVAHSAALLTTQPAEFDGLEDLLEVRGVPAV